MPEDLTWEEQVRWSRALFDSLKDGGTWIVPRSGLTFVREGQQLRLVNVTEGEDPEYDPVQDLRGIRKRFEAAGIPIVSDWD